MADQLLHPVRESRLMVVARTVLVLLTLLLVTATATRAQAPAKDEAEPAPKPPSDTATLRVELTGGNTKVPIVDASVYLKFTEDKLIRDKKIEFNLKTNQNGVARSPEIPKGHVLIQIVAPGWKTFGQYYDIVEDEQTIKVTLERPSTRWLQN